MRQPSRWSQRRRRVACHQTTGRDVWLQPSCRPWPPTVGDHIRLQPSRRPHGQTTQPKTSQPHQRGYQMENLRASEYLPAPNTPTFCPRSQTTIVEVLIAGSAAMGRAVTASVRCFCSSLRTPQLRSADNWRWANYWLRTNDLRSKARMAVSMLVSSVLSLRTPQLRIVDNQAGTNYWSAPTKFEPGCLGRWAVSSYKGPAIRRKTAIVEDLIAGSAVMGRTR